MIKILKFKSQLNLFHKTNSTIMSKKKNGRFNGVSEEEIMKKTNSLPDYLQPDLDVVFVGINPSLTAAFKGRYYAGPGNHFYKLLHASELVPSYVPFDEDYKLLEYNIGLTNIVDRATRSSADLNSKEIKRGCDIVDEKLKKFKPKLAVFNGKCIYQIFAQQFGKTKFNFGLQNEKIGDTAIWVVPSSSARCSNYPRMVDKLYFYQAIKKHILFLRGEIPAINLNEFYSMDVKKSTVNKSKNKNVTDEYPQYFITEILDGTQNKSNENEVKDKEEIGECSVKNNDTKSCYFSTDEKKGEDETVSAGGSVLSEEINDGGKEEINDEGKEEIKSFKNKGGKVKKNLKRNREESEGESQFKLKSKDKNDKGASVDFMSLIKQRLLEKEKKISNEGDDE
ncbi:G/T mismatch-specific thymine DNA glycosylase isoform X1 [Microplitis mediator]|uniref:G/T mismatch-specific thymine DNA glycosylase isoform X1 n=1 Tax=Microplitis mediator TaxID=375433 RepID=UPI0025560B2A|nr:G/T mismatch-specific thymine DNA glycosylase isoform X1 [Microplitis mediator]